jgi:hypothetical protein
MPTLQAHPKARPAKPAKAVNKRATIRLASVPPVVTTDSKLLAALGGCGCENNRYTMDRVVVSHDKRRAQVTDSRVLVRIEKHLDGDTFTWDPSDVAVIHLPEKGKPDDPDVFLGWIDSTNSFFSDALLPGEYPIIRKLRVDLLLQRLYAACAVFGSVHESEPEQWQDWQYVRVHLCLHDADDEPGLCVVSRNSDNPESGNVFCRMCDQKHPTGAVNRGAAINPFTMARTLEVFRRAGVDVVELRLVDDTVYHRRPLLLSGYGRPCGVNVSALVMPVAPSSR